MDRLQQKQHISFCFSINPIVAILGPRQCGKTTLAQQYADHYDGLVTTFDLENHLDLTRLENPILALDHLEGLIIIDEIQRRPDLFPILRVLIDKNRNTQQYLILGSASRELIRQSSETLAGRISYLELTPFQYTEVDNKTPLWLRGGYPPAFQAKTDALSFAWREAYIRTFLEQDISALGFNVPAQTMRQFWAMLAHYHGQIFNASEIGKSLKLSHNTVKKYLDILAGTLMVRILRPWHENLKKRQVKTPKIYFRDSGILHTLLHIVDQPALSAHPRLGASWEGFVLEEIIRKHMPSVDAHDCYFWRSQAGAELDLLILSGGKKIGYEIKYQDAPKITRSMRIALEDLKLDRLYVVYPGEKSFALSDRIFLTNLKDLTTEQLV